MTNHIDVPPAPSRELRVLDRLVGDWQVTGGAEGTVTYEWMDGGYFLLQRVALTQFGEEISGLEIIGNLRPFGEPVGADVMSRFYDSTGNTLDYVYELEGDTLTIWAGATGGPAYFRGTFAPDGDSLDGEWTYPGGGGYRSTMWRPPEPVSVCGTHGRGAPTGTGPAATRNRRGRRGTCRGP